MTDLLGGLIYAKRTPHMGVFLSLSDTSMYNVGMNPSKSQVMWAFTLKLIPFHGIIPLSIHYGPLLVRVNVFIAGLFLAHQNISSSNFDVIVPKGSRTQLLLWGGLVKQKSHASILRFLANKILWGKFFHINIYPASCHQKGNYHWDLWTWYSSTLSMSSTS